MTATAPSPDPEQEHAHEERGRDPAAIRAADAAPRLRDYVPSDLDSVHRFASDAAVVEHLPFGPSKLADTEAFLRRAMESTRASPRRYEVALSDRETGQLIGGIRLSVQSEVHRDASLGYILRRDLWGRGLVTEAARALVGFGFSRLAMHRIWATCAIEKYRLAARP